MGIRWECKGGLAPPQPLGPMENLPSPGKKSADAHGYLGIYLSTNVASDLILLDIAS